MTLDDRRHGCLIGLADTQAVAEPQAEGMAPKTRGRSRTTDFSATIAYFADGVELMGCARAFFRFYDPPLPRQWFFLVNKAQTEAEVAALRHCLHRSLP